MKRVINNAFKLCMGVVITFSVISCDKDDDNIPQLNNVQNEDSENTVAVLETSTKLKTNLAKYVANQETKENPSGVISIGIGGFGCFNPEFPITLKNTTENITFTAKSDYDFILKLLKFKENSNIEVVYPISIVLKDKTKKKINNKKELEEVRKTCKSEEKTCFEFKYPLTFENKSKTAKNTVENLDSLKTFLSGLRRDVIALTYPIQVSEQGKDKTIKNDKELENLFQKCSF